MYNIEKEPAYQLYQFTLFLYRNKDSKIFEKYDNQAIYRTIINRAYYSSYSIVEAWLFNTQGRCIYSPKQLKQINKPIRSVHSQARKYLEECQNKKVSSKLWELQSLRGKADYSLYPDLTEDDLEQAIELMGYIVNKLKNMNET